MSYSHLRWATFTKSQLLAMISGPVNKKPNGPKWLFGTESQQVWVKSNLIIFLCLYSLLFNISTLLSHIVLNKHSALSLNPRCYILHISCSTRMGHEKTPLESTGNYLIILSNLLYSSYCSHEVHFLLKWLLTSGLWLLHLNTFFMCLERYSEYCSCGKRLNNLIKRFLPFNKTCKISDPHCLGRVIFNLDLHHICIYAILSVVFIQNSCIRFYMNTL